MTKILKRVTLLSRIYPEFFWEGRGSEFVTLGVCALSRTAIGYSILVPFSDTISK